ncbi:MAG: hypothetical protein Q4E81_04185 [Succinatimonas sp.]|nr:hypothetical protein [Succinatimonas sp.]
MKGLRESSKLVKQQSKKLISKKKVSKPGELPGRRTGRMRRAIKTMSSRQKYKFWSVAQVCSIPNSYFYPAILIHGRKDGSLEPRKNPITEATKLLDKKTSKIIENAVIDSIKGFGN